VKAYHISPTPSREEPVTDYSSVSAPGHPSRWLVVIVLGGVACLVVGVIFAAVAGVGWLAYLGVQNGDETAQIVLPPTGWLVTVDEDFASKRNDWEVGAQEVDYGKVDLAIQDDRFWWQLEPNSDEGMSWWSFPVFDHRLGDFYVSTECRLTSGDAANSAYGLAFRVLNSDNYYRFVIGEDQSFSVSLIEKGEWLELLSWKSTDLVRPGAVNQVAVLAKGAHYQFFINNGLAYEVDDDRLSDGWVGIIADVWGENKAEFEFDNFQVYEPEQQMTIHSTWSSIPSSQHRQDLPNEPLPWHHFLGE
jgi:hypothetical protein